MIRLLCALMLVALLSGCVLTKVASVPMRLVGAAASIIPGAGNTLHDTIDMAAEVVDEVPI